MDRTATRLVNMIVGNSEDEPVIEMHFPTAEFVFEEPCVFALGGGDFGASLNGEIVDNWRCVAAERSSVLKFRRKISGNRCYLSVSGGFGSQSLMSGSDTNIIRFGSPRLRKSERVEIGPQTNVKDATLNKRISNSLLPVYSTFPTVRILAGGEFDLLAESDKLILTEEDFVITNDSNRMGYRLKGPKLTPTQSTEMVSSSVSFGTMQLLPDGQLIILMADHQTTGGYPRVGNVIAVDLPLLAQLGANDKVAFKLIDIDEAERVTMQFEQDIRRLRIGCGFGRYW